MGQIEALEGLADGFPRLNWPFWRVQDVPHVVSGTRDPAVGRHYGHKFLYNHRTLDCRTGGGETVMSRLECRASAIASPPRRRAWASSIGEAAPR